MDLDVVLIPALALALLAALVLVVVGVRVLIERARRPGRDHADQRHQKRRAQGMALLAFGTPSLRTYHRDDYADELHCISCETLLIEGTTIHVVPLPDAGNHAMLAVCQDCVLAPLGSRE